MPVKAARPCSNRTCNGLVRDGECNVCGTTGRRDKDRAYDSRRGTAHQRGYGANWRKFRKMKLAQEPLCRDCKSEGRITMGVEPHHIIPKRDGGEDSFENTITLCKSHHSQRTAKGE